MRKLHVKIVRALRKEGFNAEILPSPTKRGRHHRLRVERHGVVKAFPMPCTPSKPEVTMRKSMRDVRHAFNHEESTPCNVLSVKMKSR